MIIHTTYMDMQTAVTMESAAMIAGTLETLLSDAPVEDQNTDNAGTLAGVLSDISALGQVSEEV